MGTKAAQMVRANEVAEAVAAERERCAKIAEQTVTQQRQIGGIFSYEGPTYYDEQVPRWRDGDKIAAAIRKLR